MPRPASSPTDRDPAFPLRRPRDTRFVSSHVTHDRSASTGSPPRRRTRSALSADRAAAVTSVAVGHEAGRAQVPITPLPVRRFSSVAPVGVDVADPGGAGGEPLASSVFASGHSSPVTISGRLIPGSPRTVRLRSQESRRRGANSSVLRRGPGRSARRVGAALSSWCPCSQEEFPYLMHATDACRPERCRCVPLARPCCRRAPRTLARL